jgi:hypothetical protein
LGPSYFYDPSPPPRKRSETDTPNLYISENDNSYRGIPARVSTRTRKLAHRNHICKMNHPYKTYICQKNKGAGTASWPRLGRARIDIIWRSFLTPAGVQNPDIEKRFLSTHSYHIFGSSVCEMNLRACSNISFPVERHCAWTGDASKLRAKASTLIKRGKALNASFALHRTKDSAPILIRKAQGNRLGQSRGKPPLPPTAWIWNRR